MKFTKELEKELKLIDIPQIDYDRYEANKERAWEQDFEACPCCGKAIKNEKYFIRTAFGGSAYLAHDDNDYDDTWAMPIGTECRKKFPEGYVFIIKK